MKQKTTMRRPEAEPFSPELLQQLKKLVATGESETLEFKRKASHPDKIVRELVAFANTRGGTLLVGVSDDGNLSGLKFPDEEAYAIRRAVRRYCRPHLKYKERIIPIAINKFVVMYEVPSSNRKPHMVVYHRFRRESLIRVADKSVKASREMQAIVRLRQQNTDIQFTYGEHERTLLRYLAEHTTITVNEFAQLTGLLARQASDTLVTLVAANVLTITPHERGDQFALTRSLVKRD